MNQASSTNPVARAIVRAFMSGILVVSIIGTLSVSPLFAQQSGQLTGIGESDVMLLSSGWQTLAAGEQIAYSVNITETGEMLNVWMNVAAPDSATLELWTSEAYAELTTGTEGTPLATGAALQGAPGLVTLQQTIDTAGAHVVLISATADFPAQYLLNVTGPGLELPAPPPANTATTLPVALNVREGPSTAYPVIVTVDQGTPLTVLGRNALNTWISVQLADGTLGWVTRSLTDFTGEADLVEVPPLGGVTPDPATPGTGGTADGAAPGLGETAPITGTETTTSTEEGAIPGSSEQLDTPAANQSLSNNWRVLQAGQMDVYTFQHTGGNSPVHIWMDLQPANGAGFGVYDQASADAIMAGGDINEFTAIGQGTPNPTEPGYLFWRGTFEEAGDFYVLVNNGSDGNVNYSIYAAGPGLARGSDE